MASSQNMFGQSKEYLDLVKSIGEARSKAEEDRIVVAEIETLKRRIAEPDIPKWKMKEFILRLAYVEMLGHDASFGYIYAVKMTHDDSIALKRTGYLAVTLLLNEDHDFIILIVNTIQKDLKSDNYLVVCAALNAVCRLINEETIPAVLPQVVELIGHPNEAVRKKAIMALHRFYQRSPASVSHLVTNFRKRLSDNDPGVMGAALCPLFDLITIDPDSYKDLVTSFVSILKQVAECRLPRTYDYHQIPAPFIQIKLLKILALLGSGDKHASGQMYTVVGDIVRRCDQLSNIGNAVLYESVCCVAAIYPNSKLLGAAADAISRFLKSDSHNLKYMGIDALRRLVKINPEVAEQHQLAVIDCLEDPDDTLKRKTFELLYKMTKLSNVEVIVDRMIDYIVNINDTHYKTEIASRCVELAEHFAPSNQWFIQTMNKVFEHAGNLVNIKVAHNLMRLIAEGFGEEDDTADSLLKLSAVESYLRLVGEPKLPSVFLQVICWVLGEYGIADGKYPASYITGKLCDVAEAYSSDNAVKAYAITAVMKIMAFELAAGRKVDMLLECQSLIEDMKASHSTDLQQRAYEIQALLSLDSHVAGSIMPLDASCEDIEVDENLSFLDGYITQSLEKGAQPYIPESERSGISSISDFRGPGSHEASTHSLRFEAYELPKAPVPHISSTELVPVPESSYNREIQQTTSAGSVVAPDVASNEVRLKLDGVQKKWGRPSYSSPSAASSSTPDKASSGVPVQSHEGRDRSYDSKKKPQKEISQEKQKLAASLFGGISKDERASSSIHKRTKSAGHNIAKSHVTSSIATPNEAAVEKRIPPPLPDLLDLDETANSDITATIDPSKQLEGLLEASAAKEPDTMGLYGATPTSGPSPSMDSVNNLLFGSTNTDNNRVGLKPVSSQAQQENKGFDPKDSLHRDGSNPVQPESNLVQGFAWLD